MAIGGQHGDVARHFTQAVVLHQDLAQLAQGMALVGAIHRRARVDQVAQAAVVIAVDGLAFGEHLDDGRHGEQVVHAVFLHQAPGLVAVQFVTGRQDAGSAPGDVDQRMDAGTVGQRSQDQRTRMLIQARHQVGDVVGDDKRHLAVGQHPGLGMARGARGVEKPQRVVVRHFGRTEAGLQRAALLQQLLVAQFAGTRLTDGDDLLQARRCRTHGVDIMLQAFVIQHRYRAAGTAQVGRFRRGDPHVGRHPHGAQAERDPGTLEQRQVVARMHQQLVAFTQAARAQGRSNTVDPPGNFLPGMLTTVTNETRCIRIATRDLVEHFPQIHHVVDAHHCARSRMLT